MGYDVNPARIIVGFEPGITPSRQLQVLSGLAAFDSVEINLSAEMAVVVLKPGTTCSKSENILKLLERKREVQYTLPTFYGYVLPTNKFDVELTSQSYYPDLQRLAKATKTRISGTNPMNGYYIVETDKRSRGNVFDMITVFSQKSYTWNSELKTIFYFPDFPLCDTCVIPFRNKPVITQASFTRK